MRKRREITLNIELEEGLRRRRNERWVEDPKVEVSVWCRSKTVGSLTVLRPGWAARRGGELRLGISSSAPTPILVEGLAEGESEDRIVAAARRAISPISDLRCSKEYREFMVETFVKRLLREVA